MARNQGFSLIELSIVLVVIAALVGGVIMGQSLIRNAELRAIPAEYTLYSGAMKAFRDQYSYYPGDFPTATSIWGDDNTNCADAAITNGNPGTCNGNGDGILTGGIGTGAKTGDAFEFFRQLSLAGMIPGTYTGLSGPTGGTAAVPGSNTPASKVKGSGWSILYIPRPISASSDGVKFDLDYLNAFTFGQPWLLEGFYGPNEINALTPAEAQGIDRKMDDGSPTNGIVIVYGDWGSSGAPATSICTIPNSGSAAFDNLDASYNLANKTTACGLAFVRQ